MAVTVNLDRPRKMVLNVRAVSAVEDHFKASIFSLVSDRMGLSVLSVMLWQGLKTEDPALTLDKTQDLLQDALSKEGGLAEVSEAMRQALEDSGLTPKAKAPAAD